MEFKKPNSNHRTQPGRNASRPIDTNFITPRSHPRPAPPIITSSAQSTPPPVARVQERKTHTKDTSDNRPSLRDVITSYVRGFRFTKKTTIVIGSILVMTIIGILLVSINQQNIAKNAANSGNPNEVVRDLEYQTILPDGKSIDDLGGWRRVSPSKSEPVYAYTDSIGKQSINVSEQPLPDSFIGNTDDEVSELAKKFNATTKIQAGDVTVYVGSSSKGPQSVIFAKNSLLVLIKSQEKIDDEAWIKYIKSLN